MKTEGAKGQVGALGGVSRDGLEARFSLRPSALRCGGRVLLVEDEPAVRDLTAHQLRRLGYEVQVARDAAEALRLVQAEPEQEIDLLLTDVVMPGLSGPQLARELASRRPGLRTLFISGYARDAAVLTEVLDSGARLLSKPFGQAELALALRDVLGATPPGS